MKEHEINIANWEACRDRKEGYLTEIEQAYLGNISGKKICVLGSGDNLLVFRYAKLGAEMTSVDISKGMLDIAIGRAKELNLDIRFVQSDVIDLKTVAADQFDIVYTGGHVTLWISDLKRFFSEAFRIVKSGGIFMVSEYHPFRQLWKEVPDTLELAHDYFSVGPIEVQRIGRIPSYNYHWTIRDYVAAMLASGFELVGFEEVGMDTHPDEIPPVKGLPRVLVLLGKKK